MIRASVVAVAPLGTDHAAATNAAVRITSNRPSQRRGQWCCRDRVRPCDAVRRAAHGCLAILIGNGERRRQRWEYWTVFEPQCSLRPNRLAPVLKEAWPTNAAARRRWLGGRESNPDSLVQSQLSYH